MIFQFVLIQFHSQVYGRDAVSFAHLTELIELDELLTFHMAI